MTTVLDGKAVAGVVRDEVARDAAAFKARTGRAPGLAVVLVGEDPGSVIYTRSKAKAAAKTGFHDDLRRLPAEISEAELLAVVDELNRDPRIDGILVQLPLPKHVDEHRVIQAIDPEKDADGFHPVNAGRLSIGLPGPVPCTPKGVMTLMKRHGIDPAGKEAVVVGRSNIVGKPMAALLLAQNATVTICHSRTPDLAFHTRRADVLVSAIGRPRMIGGEMVKHGVVAIDVGINRLPDGTIVGDLDYDSVAAKAAAITPVPGGVGPMTIATLLANVLELANRRVPA